MDQAFGPGVLERGWVGGAYKNPLPPKAPRSMTPDLEIQIRSPRVRVGVSIRRTSTADATSVCRVTQQTEAVLAV